MSSLLCNNIIIRLYNPVELSHKWSLTNFKHQKPEFYARIFYESEKGSFEIPAGRTKVGVISFSEPGSPKLYFL